MNIFRKLIASIALVGFATQLSAQTITAGVVANAPASGIHNATPQNLQRWRRLKNDVIGGSQISGAPASICTIGDSTVAGLGPTAPQRQKGWPSYLAKRLTNAGIPTDNQSFFGGSNQSQTLAGYNAYNTAVVLGTGWTFSSMTAGGPVFQAASSVTTSLSFTITNADTIEVYSGRSSGNGTFSVDTGGAALATVDEGSPASDGFVRTVVSLGSVGTYTVNIKRTNGGTNAAGTIGIDGIVVRNSTTSQIIMVNMGWGSSTSAMWNDTSFLNRPLSAASAIKPNAAFPSLCFVDLGINDRTASYGPVPVETYRANLTAIVTALLANTDVVLIIPNPSGTSRVDANTQAAYNQVIRDVAIAKNIPWIDVPEVWTDWNTANGINYMSDDVHPFQRGYSDMADILFRMLLLF